MSKSISLDPKTRTGHIILGIVLAVLALASLINLANNGFTIFNIIFALLFVWGTVDQFVKAGKEKA